MEEKGLAPLPTWVAVPEHQTMGAKELVMEIVEEYLETHERMNAMMPGLEENRLEENKLEENTDESEGS